LYIGDIVTFSMEYIPQTFSNIPQFQTQQNTKVRAKIERNGDLIYDIYLTYKLPALFYNNSDIDNSVVVGWTNNVGII